VEPLSAAGVLDDLIAMKAMDLRASILSSAACMPSATITTMKSLYLVVALISDSHCLKT